MNVGHATIKKYFNLDKEKGVNLNIFFSANNGFFTQLLRMRFINENWYTATKIIRDKDNKVLFTNIDVGYPIRDKKIIFE